MPETIFVFDIDSTIANNDHRANLLAKQCNVCLSKFVASTQHGACFICHGTSISYDQKSWDAFLDADAVAKDTPIDDAIRVLNKLRELNANIVFLTGRNEDTLGEVTKWWLSSYAGWKPESEKIYMRTTADHGLPASTYKERALNRLKADVGENCMFIFFEDDPYVFNLYNQHGICIACPEGLEHFIPFGARGDESAFNR